MAMMRATAHWVAGGLLAWSVIAAAQSPFHGRLSTVPIDTQTRATTTGSGSLRASLDGNRLTINGSFEGLAGSATTAALHVGPAPAARGPAAHELSVTQAASGEISGTVRLSRAELDALMAGRVYVQIHSTAAPEGNLWGWLLE